jgi:putative metalloprotease
MKIKSILLICMLTISLSACKTDGLISSAGSLVTGLTINETQLKAEAKLSAQEMDKKIPIAPAGNQYAVRLHNLTKNMTTYDGLTLNYKVYLVDEVNAFAMPDGTVRVYAGLMDLMNDDEVLAVIGHEIGHVALKHSLQQYKKAYLAKAAREGLSATDSTVGNIAGAYGDIGEAFLNAQFSQKDELESDAYGVTVLHKMGHDPYAAVRAQEKLQQLGSQDSVFSSHPPSQKRIDLARAAADKITGK